MRVLFISDRRDGGIRSHVQCLTSCLPLDVVCYAIGEDEPFAGKSGHSIRELFQIRRIIRTFKPEVVHFHTIPLLMALYVRFVARLPRVSSIHTPSFREVTFSRWLVNWAVMPCYFLPVSGANWEVFRLRYPSARGEVFFNPVVIGQCPAPETKNPGQDHVPILGMVGRNAEQKDWPSFHAVMDRVIRSRPVQVWNLGEREFCPDAAKKIVEMDLFVMTSRHEELPTTVLECFRARTPICGFIPRGGMEDILALSNGALREVFIEERDPDKLASIVTRILDDPDLGERIVTDGWRILTQHFDAMKNVRGQLMNVYRKVLDHA